MNTHLCKCTHCKAKATVLCLIHLYSLLFWFLLFHPFARTFVHEDRCNGCRICVSLCQPRPFILLKLMFRCVEQKQQT